MLSWNSINSVFFVQATASCAAQFQRPSLLAQAIDPSFGHFTVDDARDEDCRLSFIAAVTQHA
jgi:hypothetical protein